MTLKFIHGYMHLLIEQNKEIQSVSRLCNLFTYLKDIRVFIPTFRYSLQFDMLICQVGIGHQIQH